MPRLLTILPPALMLAIFLAESALGQTNSPAATAPRPATETPATTDTSADLEADPDSVEPKSVNPSSVVTTPPRRTRLEQLRDDLTGARLIGQIEIQRGHEHKRIEKKLQSYVDSINLTIEEIVELPNGKLRLETRFGKAAKPDARPTVRRRPVPAAASPRQPDETSKQPGIHVPIDVDASYHGPSVVLSARSLYIPGLGIANGRLILRDDNFAARWQARGYEGIVRGSVYRPQPPLPADDAPDAPDTAAKRPPTVAPPATTNRINP